MRTLKIFSLALVMVVATAANLNSQCKSYIKRSCVPKLTPYVHSGQLNKTVLFPGDKAEIMLTFYSGMDYRIIVCSEVILGKVTYKVMDMDRNLIFDSAKEKDKGSFDFKVASTQQLMVEITVPQPIVQPEILPQGCVAVVVGYKD
jgi:hypothetical protein